MDKLRKIENIGIMGGTFNPVHIAHLIISEIFIEDLKLDKCILVPANISPFKLGNLQVITESSEQRIDMLNLAISNKSNYLIDTYEILQGGVSYSHNTVQYLKEKYPDSKLFLFIGTDQAINFKKWKNWKDILNITQLCIADRSNNNQRLKKSINSKLTINEKQPVWVQNPYLEISSTMIRQRVLEGKTIKHLVTPEVEDYIYSNNLYKQ